MSETKTNKPFILTGKHVFWSMFAFFAVIAAVNAYMITRAVETFRGEDEKKSYLQGLGYNTTIEKRRVQAALGWQADLKIKDGQVTLTINDTAGAPVRGLTVTGLLKHPAETDLDQALTFAQNANGQYVTTLAPGTKGSRHLYTVAKALDGREFKTRNEDIWLK